MLFSKQLFLVAVFLFGVNAYADPPTMVLGVPLGGKISPNMKICPLNTDKAKEVCWISKPFTGKSGGRLGYIHFPNQDAFPAWAVHAMFTIEVGKDGEINTLTVESFGSNEKHTIANSITSRFGLPKETTLPRDDYAFASWTGKNIYIRLECASKCSTTFRSPSAQAEVEQRAAEYRKKQAARPASP